MHLSEGNVDWKPYHLEKAKGKERAAKAGSRLSLRLWRWSENQGESKQCLLMGSAKPLQGRRAAGRNHFILRHC
jgi:hypothetical protein